MARYKIKLKKVVVKHLLIHDKQKGRRVTHMAMRLY